MSHGEEAFLSEPSTFVPCRNCGHRVYQGARRCPVCRRRMHLTASERLMIAVVILLVVGGAWFAWLARA